MNLTLIITQSIIQDYVDYNVYLPDGVTFEAIEQKLTLLNNLTDWLGEIYYPCVEAYYQYSCPFAFPRCSTSIINSTEGKLTCIRYIV